MYDFQKQLVISKIFEAQLDGFFNSLGVEIKPVSMELERLGIDRIFYVGKERLSVEYKIDLTAQRTGNAFVETEVANKAGWAYTSTAQVLVYFVPPMIYLCPMLFLKGMVEQWSKQYKASPPIKNRGYVARGILVPLTALPCWVKFNLEKRQCE